MMLIQFTSETVASCVPGPDLLTRLEAEGKLKEKEVGPLEFNPMATTPWFKMIGPPKWRVLY